MEHSSPPKREGTKQVPVTAAQLLVQCLENEGVKYAFGIPGEENIHVIDALDKSSIHFVLVRHEQAASFMADIYGRLTDQAGVCIGTLGPGAINLLLGTADANTDSVPLVAITAQGGLNRIYKESHQIIDLVSMFKPVTKWAELIPRPEAVPEMVRKAFKLAQTERPGAVYLALPEDVEKMVVPTGYPPLEINVVRDTSPSPAQISRAAKVLEAAKNPVMLAGHGAVRNHASEALVRVSERLHIPVATTFMGKGVFPDNHPNALGTIGVMVRDYANFGFDQADVILSVGYDMQEFDPVKINPTGDKQIIHIHRYPAQVDAHYHLAVGIQGDISESLDALARETKPKPTANSIGQKIRHLLKEELEMGRNDNSYPVKPQRLVADIRAAMGAQDIALVDTGAVKMWMARLYPTYQPNTCIVSNGLSTMAFALPGAIAAKLAFPDRKVLAIAGDAGFLMNSMELETAVREKIPLVVLAWVDGSYGMIKWEMDLELGHHSHVDFGNPDFVKFAESFGAKGYLITRAGDLLPTLKRALADNHVSVIACPVDYSQNAALTNKLGKLTEPM
ncbi:acetolactate synthase large subunit [Candidatus Bathyarchaeota archaeon]|nr:MAG: acetolactate synthase large subunit [Candidatus Bathyarchaeota archaeon]